MQETMLDGVTGYLVERDPKRFADAIMDLFANPQKAKQMGEAGRKQVTEQWTWDIAALRLEAYLESAARLN
jgi:phosphatidylinositol alpha-1,6-mannosyltransferase